MSNKAKITEFKNGLTVKELKEIVKGWPETNKYTGEDCEVWIETGRNLSSIVTTICPLNKRTDNGEVSADIIFETDSFNT